MWPCPGGVTFSSAFSKLRPPFMVQKQRRQSRRGRGGGARGGQVSTQPASICINLTLKYMSFLTHLNYLNICRRSAWTPPLAWAPTVRTAATLPWGGSVASLSRTRRRTRKRTRRGRRVNDMEVIHVTPGWWRMLCTQGDLENLKGWWVIVDDSSHSSSSKMVN